MQRSKFLRAASEGDLETVKSIAASTCTDLSEVRDFANQNALIIASRRGNLLLVKLLLHRIKLNNVNIYGCTALIYACYYGYTTVARLLLKHGSDPNILDTQDLTALMYASRFNHINVVKLLLDSGVDPNVANSDGWTALTWGIGNVAMVRLLMFTSPIRDIRGRTMLMIAIIYNFDSVQFLLDETEAEVDARDCNGLSALNYAVQGKRLNIVRELLGRVATVTEFDRCNCFNLGTLAICAEFSRY